MSGGTPATVLLDQQAVDYRLHSYKHDPRSHRYGEEAAEALGVDTGRLFKTLVTEVDRTLVCAVVPVSHSLSLKALALAHKGKRADMADPAKAQRATGYVVGGISPLGQRSRIPAVVDSSAMTWDTIFVSAGKRGMQVELAPADLIRLTDATVADIAAE